MDRWRRDQSEFFSLQLFWGAALSLSRSPRSGLAGRASPKCTLKSDRELCSGHSCRHVLFERLLQVISELSLSPSYPAPRPVLGYTLAHPETTFPLLLSPSLRTWTPEANLQIKGHLIRIFYFHDGCSVSVLLDIKSVNSPTPWIGLKKYNKINDQFLKLSDHLKKKSEVGHLYEWGPAGAPTPPQHALGD